VTHVLLCHGEPADRNFGIEPMRLCLYCLLLDLWTFALLAFFLNTIVYRGVIKYHQIRFIYLAFFMIKHMFSAASQSVEWIQKE
jgi:hypothetical protein